MRETVRRHLGKVVAGTAIAVASTAVMVGITLPGTAGADDTPGGGVTSAAASPGQDGDGGDASAVAPARVEGPADEGEKGVGRDPLTEDETERVTDLAESPALFKAGEDVEGERGLEELSVELEDPEGDELDDPNAPRRAQVTYYDYKTDSVIARTVNLRTGKVEETITKRGVQPPLSRDEATEAARLLLADPLSKGLKEDYRDATGKKLTSPDQLQLHNMIFRADPGVSPKALAACGEHRCAQLMVKVPNGPWIDTRTLIIDLSTREVHRLERG